MTTPTVGDHTVGGRHGASVVRLPRPLHPAAWWVWALGLGTAATWTSNPLLLLLIIAVASFVVSNRRAPTTSTFGFKLFLWLGFAIVVLRLAFRMVFGGGDGGTILFTLPEIPLPEVAAGIRLGGPVSAEALLAALYDGLRLAALLICVGAANVLADPKRLLKSVPAALHEIGVAITVALTVAPQLVASAARIRRARRLRGAGGRKRAIRGLLLPVLEDALDRSLKLAAAMDVRGYGRTAAVPERVRRITSLLMLVGLVGAAIGTYGLLDETMPRWLGIPALTFGLTCAVCGLVLAGWRISRSIYRPDRWRPAEWMVAATGIGAAVVLNSGVATDALARYPSTMPPMWPPMPLVPTVAILVAALPAFIAPPVTTVHHRAPSQPSQTPRSSRPSQPSRTSWTSQAPQTSKSQTSRTSQTSPTPQTSPTSKRPQTSRTSPPLQTAQPPHTPKTSQPKHGEEGTA